MDYEIIIINSDDNIETVQPRIRFTKEQIKKAFEAGFTKVNLRVSKFHTSQLSK